MIKVFVCAVLVSAIFIGCAIFEPTEEEIKMKEIEKFNMMREKEIKEKAIEFERQGFDKEMANALAHIWKDSGFGNLDLYKKILDAGSK